MQSSVFFAPSYYAPPVVSSSVLAYPYGVQTFAAPTYYSSPFVIRSFAAPCYGGARVRVFGGY